MRKIALLGPIRHRKKAENAKNLTWRQNYMPSGPLAWKIKVQYKVIHTPKVTLGALVVAYFGAGSA